MPKVKSKSRGDGGLLPIDPIPFVRQSSNSASPNEKSANISQQVTLDGRDIRSFYESVVQLNDDEQSESHVTSPQTKKDRKQNKHSRKRRSSRIKSEHATTAFESQPALDFFKMRNELFMVAESGNVKELGNLIKQGVDVNCQDQYGWTALMCAAQSGQSGVITYLLDRGGDASVRNTKGQSAWDIAHLAKKHKVLDAITNHGKEVESKDREMIHYESYLCEICNETIEGITQEKHNASTVHQLNMKHTVNNTVYQIPGHNRGFQLMLKSGWDQEKGLGPSGTGQKYPVKTHLKRDRKGLGIKAKDDKPRVTHFEPYDKKAIEHKHRQERTATLNKRAASKKAKKEKEMERKFRMEWI